MGSVGVTIGLALGIIFAVLLIVLLIWLRLCLVIVKEGTKKVVERFGVYRRTLDEGIHFIFKPFDRIALNPWSAMPDETFELLQKWDMENNSSAYNMLSNEEYELMERRISDIKASLGEAKSEEERKYWFDLLQSEKNRWDEKIEGRLEKHLGLDQYYDLEEDGEVEERYPSTDMDAKELRHVIAGSDSNKSAKLSSANATGRYRITPAGYTRSLDTHEAIDYIDMRECFVDMGENPVITLDNASVGVNTCFFYQVTDVYRYYYGVDKPLEAIKKLTLTALRNMIGSLTLEQTLISRKDVNKQLREALDEATNGWGIKINRVEIEELKLSDDIKQAMNDVLIADRRRRVKIIDADAEATYYLKLKEAEAEGYLMIKEAAPDESVLRIKGYEAIKHLADGQSTKIFVPGSLNNIVTGSHIFADAFDDVINTNGATKKEPAPQTEESETKLTATVSVQSETAEPVEEECSENVGETVAVQENC